MLLAIVLIHALMRYVCQNHQGIHLTVTRQNAEVADVVCKLNYWQKIAPMNGLTNPTRYEIRAQKEKTPSMKDPVPWVPEVLEWKVEQMTKVNNEYRPKGRMNACKEGGGGDGGTRCISGNSIGRKDEVEMGCGTAPPKSEGRRSWYCP